MRCSHLVTCVRHLVLAKKLLGPRKGQSNAVYALDKLVNPAAEGEESAMADFLVPSALAITIPATTPVDTIKS